MKTLCVYVGVECRLAQGYINVEMLILSKLTRLHRVKYKLA